tara:strand:+ start:10804 stop:13377 length:2574 start_codon:yes stop_codon:yes gene_type:complete
LLKFNENYGSGNVSLAVWDDGTAAPTGNLRRVGPRWGVATNTGYLLGAIMYAPYLSDKGSICILDANPRKTGWFGGLHYYSHRTYPPKWQTWQFDFDPSKGVTIKVDGKQVPRKRFDWNETAITGMNQVALFGDEPGKAGAQTIWVAVIEIETGPPMATKPVKEPPSPTVVPGSDPEPTGTVWHLKQELQGQHPRLLITQEELPELRQFYYSEAGEPWRRKIEGYLPAATPPTHKNFLRDATDAQRQGLWRLPTVALHYLITEDPESLKNARGFLETFSELPTWELGKENNSGMAAANIMIGAALAYDWLYNDLDPEFREQFGNKLRYHARAMYYGGHRKGNPGPHYWQNDPANNHRWHRNAGLTLSILAVYESRPEEQWLLQQTIEELDFVTQWLPEDGSSHEGPSYFTFGGNHLVLAMDAADGAIGTNYLQNEYLQRIGEFRLHTLLPGMSGIFPFGDAHQNSVGGYNNFLLKGASIHQQAAIKDGLYQLLETNPKTYEFGWFSLLWEDPDLSRGELSDLETEAYFADIGFASMRDGWSSDAVAASFICGPFGGYGLVDYSDGGKQYINVAHDDPDANEFLIARGPYLLVDSDGYSKQKASQNHNTILVNGMGQMSKGRPENTVWSQPGGSMEKMAYITAWKPTSKVIAIEGEAAGSYLAYKNKKSGRSRPALDRYRRTFLWVENNYILVLDDIRSPSPVEVTWLLQASAISPVGEIDEQRFRLYEAEEKMDMQWFSDPSMQSSFHDSPADHRGESMGLKQIRLQGTSDRHRIASTYDAWDNGDLTMELTTVDENTATIRVTGPGFKDLWTWEAAINGNTASTLIMERIQGNTEGLPFELGPKDTRIEPLSRNID